MKHVDPASEEFVRLPKQEQAKIYYFEFGWTVPAIAEELDEGRKTIGEWLDGVVRLPKEPQRRCKLVGPEVNKVHALYEAGMSPKEIVKSVKLSQASVYRVLAEKYGPRRHQEAA